MIRFADYIEKRFGLSNIVRLMGVLVMASFVLAAWTFYRESGDVARAEHALCMSVRKARSASNDNLRDPLRETDKRLGFSDLAAKVKHVKPLGCS